MSGRLVIVDDSNPSIKYTGDWFTQESADSTSREFNGTVHATNTAGSLLEYKFRGTGITVYGTLATPQTGAAVSRMTVDSGTPLVFNSSAIPSTSASILSHVALFQVSNLQDAEHTVNVIVDEVPDTHTFYFDFFTVNSSEGGDQFVIMDDSDSSISYLGEWKSETVQEAYGGTHHKSPDTEGGKATVRFKGTSIQVFGMMDDELHAVLNITLDSSSPKYYRPEAGDSVPRHSVVFTANDLALADHELVIENMVTGPFYLDYVVYATTGQLTSSQTASVVSPSAQPSGGSSTTMGPQTGIQPTDGSSQSSKPPTSAIVGGVIGGIAVLALLGALCFFLGRWRRVQSSDRGTAVGLVRGRKSKTFSLGHFTPYTESTPYNPFRESRDTSASQRHPLPNVDNPFIIPPDNQLLLTNGIGSPGAMLIDSKGGGRSPSGSPMTPQSQEIRHANEVMIPMMDLPRSGNTSPRSAGSSGLSRFTLLQTPSDRVRSRSDENQNQAQTDSTPNTQQTFSSPSNYTTTLSGWTSSPPPAYHDLR